MATNITTDNLIGQFCSLINTNAAGVANVDDLLIYKYAGGSLQRITAQLMRDYFLAGLSTQMSGYATTTWVTQQLATKADAATISSLSTSVNNAANAAATAKSIAEGVRDSQVFCTQEVYDGYVAAGTVDPNITYFIYEDE